MATWIMHLMIADSLLERFPTLHRTGFCVGNIAPDCNIENEDWTQFIPSREITHWMQGEQKQLSDGEHFYNAYLKNSICDHKSGQEYAFLLGYYAHILTDAAYQVMLRDENRVKSVWERIRSDRTLNTIAHGYHETWDSVKKLLSKNDMMREIDQIEAEYLSEHPDSGFIEEILLLKQFSDYLDYMPHGCIVRKIGIMAKIPENKTPCDRFVAISRTEYADFVEQTIRLLIQTFFEKSLV